MESTNSAATAKLHQLVEALPPHERHTAERFMTYLCHLSDPLEKALAEAPVSDEPLTGEDNAALHEARRSLQAGAVVSDEELRTELGIYSQISHQTLSLCFWNTKKTVHSGSCVQIAPGREICGVSSSSWCWLRSDPIPIESRNHGSLPCFLHAGPSPHHPNRD